MPDEFEAATAQVDASKLLANTRELLAAKGKKTQRFKGDAKASYRDGSLDVIEWANSSILITLESEYDSAIDEMAEDEPSVARRAVILDSDGNVEDVILAPTDDQVEFQTMNPRTLQGFIDMLAA